MILSSPDLSLRLLSPSALSAVLAFFVSPVTSHTLPRQTSTLQQQPGGLSNPVPWPLPTPDPLAARQASSPHYASDQLLLPRQLNTVCGFIGGDAVLPATCSLGSHCVADVQNSVIGCCPDVGPCTTGVFTDCVDGSSGAQAAVNPFVFTCTGGEVCFQNRFEGGFVQFGCDATSRPIATVVPSAIGGGAAISLPTVSASITGTRVTATTLTFQTETATSTTETNSDPTSTTTSNTATRSNTRTSASTAGKTNTKPSTTNTVSSTGAASETSTTTTDTNSDGAQPSATTGSSTTGPSAIKTGGAADDNNDGGNGDGKKNIGAIVGGTIGGVAGAALIAVLILLLLRRKKGKENQQGPTDQYAQYLSNPMTSQDPKPPPPAMIEKPRFSQGPLLAQRNAGVRSPEPYTSSMPYWPPGESGGSGIGGAGSSSDTDETPLTGRIPPDPYYDEDSGGGRGSQHTRDDSNPFPRFSGDESRYSESDYTSTYGTYPGPRRGGGSGVLWQQNRDASRNPSWV